jgi:hypothetical protein
MSGTKQFATLVPVMRQLNLMSIFEQTPSEDSRDSPVIFDDKNIHET